MFGFFDILQTGFDNGKGAKAQKVHFYQSDGLNKVTVILGSHQAFSFGRHNRDMVG